MECPGEFLSVAESVALRLGEIERVVAVALGGSCARGTAEKDSDLDLGIYYRSSKPPRWNFSDGSPAIFRRKAPRPR
jgi:predicted nucleotidyltransferase